MSQHTRLHKYIELIIGIFVMSIIGSYRWLLWTHLKQIFVIFQQSWNKTLG